MDTEEQIDQNNFGKLTFLKTLVLSVALLSFTTASAQQTQTPLDHLAFEQSTYNTAIGVRAAEPGALTLKHFFNDQVALEGILGVWNHGFRATLLLEKHVPTAKVSGLSWYYGAGAHLSYYDHDHWFRYNERRYYPYFDDEIGLGVDGVLGIEYKIPEIPFALSLDVKPTIEYVSNGDVWADFDPGLGVKLTF